MQRVPEHCSWWTTTCRKSQNAMCAQEGYGRRWSACFTQVYLRRVFVGAQDGGAAARINGVYGA